MVDKKFDADVAQFCAVTGASTRDARDFLKQHKRLDVAIDAYYTNPNAFAGRRKAENNTASSVARLEELFDKYKDEDGDEIGINGTLKFCQDLSVDPEDVVFLAVAYELKSPRMGHWTRQGWIDGWKSLRVYSLLDMQTSLPRLRNQLAADPEYFRKVYSHAFDFARVEGQRSIGLEIAQALWALLLTHGFDGGALTRKNPDDDVNMEGGGWQKKYNEWWFDFLKQKGGKGISKDTWAMFLEFVRSIDAKFSNYDIDAAWPSIIDDFIEYAQARLASASN